MIYAEILRNQIIAVIEAETMPDHGEVQTVDITNITVPITYIDPDTQVETVVDEQPQVGWKYDGTTFIKDDFTPWGQPTTPALVTRLTRLEFFDKFTEPELEGIYTAAKTVVQLEIMLDKFKAAEYIELTDLRTMYAISALESSSFLANGRAAEILGQ